MNYVTDHGRNLRNAVLVQFGLDVVRVLAIRRAVLWLFFSYIATLATILPFGLYLTGLKTISPTMAVLTGMLQPMVASLGSFLLLGETLRPVQMLGGLLIVGAVRLLQLGQWRTR